MTSFAPVAPLSALKRLDEAGVLGTYQLLIAPIVLKDEERYTNFFRAHHDQFVIVDNGVIEQGFAMPGAHLARAGRIVEASVVVMPDTIDDARMTVKQTRRGLEDFRRHDSDTDTLGVVQGTNFEECIECARQLADIGVDYLGVPRGLTPNLGSRVELVKTLAAEVGLPMHVLGFSDDLLDDVRAATSHRLVRGIDAATPVWCPRLLPTVPPTGEASRSFSRNIGRRPANFWQNSQYGTDGTHSALNVQTVRRWLAAANQARSAREGISTAPPEMIDPA